MLIKGLAYFELSTKVTLSLSYNYIFLEPTLSDIITLSLVLLQTILIIAYSYFNNTAYNNMLCNSNMLYSICIVYTYVV